MVTQVTTAAVPIEQFGWGSGAVHVLSTDADLRLMLWLCWLENITLAEK